MHVGRLTVRRLARQVARTLVFAAALNLVALVCCCPFEGACPTALDAYQLLAQCAACDDAPCCDETQCGPCESEEPAVLVREDERKAVRLASYLAGAPHARLRLPLPRTHGPAIPIDDVPNGSIDQLRLTVLIL